MKWLMKLICPSGKTLAGYAAGGIAKSVNASKEDSKAKVARYAAYAQEATRIANTLSGILADGSIDKTETEAIAEMLTPLFEKALALAE